MQQVAGKFEGPDRRDGADIPSLTPASATNPIAGLSGASRRRRLSLTRTLGRLMPPLMALVAILIFAAAYRTDGRSERPVLPFDPDEIAARLGLGIDEVSVSGHRRTLESQIFAAIDMTRIRSEASLDTALIRRRLERLPWIKRATVSRRFPGGLDILVEERAPVAITKVSGRPTLLDLDGRVLGPAGGFETGLIRIEGPGAHIRLRRLVALLNDYPEIGSRLHEAERVGERRWTLHLITGMRLMLPADDDGRADAAALAEIVKELPGGRGRLIDRQLEVIDARISHQMVVREARSVTDVTPPVGN